MCQYRARECWALASAPKMEQDSLWGREHIPPACPHAYQLKHLLAEKQKRKVGIVRNILRFRMQQPVCRKQKVDEVNEKPSQQENSSQQHDLHELGSRKAESSRPKEAWNGRIALLSKPAGPEWGARNAG